MARRATEANVRRGSAAALIAVALTIAGSAPAIAAGGGGPAATAPAPINSATSVVSVTQTDPGLSQQLSPQPGIPMSTHAPTGVPLIPVNPSVRYQQFTGLGAAMTDSSAWLIYDELPATTRDALMQHLFGSAGIGLNFLRVPMGASDFTVSPTPYTYDDVPAGQSDPTLSSFSIAHDLAYIIPALREALSINPRLEILANPWSPPAWMKANDSLGNVGGQGTLLPSAYGPLAQYFVKFLQAYASQGVPVTAITPNNEPRSGTSGTVYPGLELPEPGEASFITQDLAPALSAAGLTTRIYGNDLSWDKLSYASPLASPPTLSDLAGIAWHCYFGSPAVMSQLQPSLTASQNQLVDECSPEIRSFGNPEFLISALRNWASVAALWNIALDPQGGPKQVNNGCPGCKGIVTIDEQAQTVSYGTEYYQLGQISAFVNPGAWRVSSPDFVTYGVNSSNVETVSPGLDDVAFINPNGSKVLVAYNNSTAPIAFAVRSGYHYFSYTLPSQAMTTFVWH